MVWRKAERAAWNIWARLGLEQLIRGADRAGYPRAEDFRTDNPEGADRYGNQPVSDPSCQRLQQSEASDLHLPVDDEGKRCANRPGHRRHRSLWHNHPRTVHAPTVSSHDSPSSAILPPFPEFAPLEVASMRGALALVLLIVALLTASPTTAAVPDPEKPKEWRYGGADWLNDVRCYTWHEQLACIVVPLK